MRHLLLLSLILAGLGLTAPARADCQADDGEVDDIQASGVRVICDTVEPNPYQGGIGTTTTSTDLGVTIEEGAELISGTVGVALADAGSLENDGTISADDTAVTGTNQANGDGITVNNGGTIISASGAGIVSLLPDSIITNAGSVTARDLGVQISESTFDNSGTLDVVNAGAVGLDTGSNSSIDNSGSIRSDGIGVVIGAGSSLSNTGTITGNGGAAVTASGNATIDNAGRLSGDGGSAIELTGGGNTLTLQTGSSIDGAITSFSSTAPGDRLIFEGSGSEGDSFSGFASITMRGSDWTLNGPVTAEQTFIETGMLTINGTLTSVSGVEITGGTLAGTGTVQGNVDNTSGTLAAGNPAGTMTITGNYRQSGNAIFRVGSSNTSVGVLQVNGTAELAGSLIIEAGPDLVADILIADGGISGAFDSFSVEGRALVAIVPAADRIQMVRASTTLEDNMVEAGLDNSYLTLDSLASGIYTRPASGIWMKALGSYNERDEVDGLPGGDYTIGGGGIGGDWQMTDRFRVGGLFAYTSTDLDSDDGGDGQADNYNYGLYINYDQQTSWGGIWGTLAVAAGSSDYDQDRSILINDTREKVAASYDGTAYAMRGILGTRHAFLGDLADTWVFEPSLGVDYVVLDLDDYQERSGAGLNYSIDDIESLQLQATLRTRRLLIGDRGFAPRFQLGVVRRIAVDDREWSATSDAGGLGLSLQGNDDDTTSLAAAAGFEFQPSPRIYTYADWIGEFSEDKRRYSLVLGLRFNIGAL